jgi:hypothetical protein
MTRFAMLLALSLGLLLYSGCERFTQKKAADSHAGETAAEHAAHSDHHEGETAEEHAKHDDDHKGETKEEHEKHDDEHHEGESKEEHEKNEGEGGGAGK